LSYKLHAFLWHKFLGSFCKRKKDRGTKRGGQRHTRTSLLCLVSRPGEPESMQHFNMCVSWRTFACVGGTRAVMKEGTAYPPFHCLWDI